MTNKQPSSGHAPECEIKPLSEVSEAFIRRTIELITKYTFDEANPIDRRFDCIMLFIDLMGVFPKINNLLCERGYLVELDKKMDNLTLNIKRIIMTEQELNDKIDAANAVLAATATQLEKVSAEVVSAAEAQFKTIADLKAQLEAAGGLSPEVQVHLDTLAATTGTLSGMAQALDDLNADVVVKPTEPTA